MGAKKFSTKQFVELALLVAVIVLLAFTPIGYIRTFGLEITLIVVPVTVGAVTLGPAAGAVLGAVCGITSFIQCFGMSPFGAVLLGINPAATFVVCVISRVLMGWLTGAGSYYIILADLELVQTKAYPELPEICLSRSFKCWD